MGVEHLRGAAGADDVFTILETGSLDGSVDGGDGGFDTLVLHLGDADGVVSSATGSTSGRIAYGERAIA